MENILFSPIRLDELEILIEKSVQRALRDQVKEKEIPDLLTVVQVAEYLRKKPNTIRTLASQRKISSMKRGGRLYFRKSDIEAYLEEGIRR